MYVSEAGFKDDSSSSLYPKREREREERLVAGWVGSRLIEESIRSK